MAMNANHKLGLAFHHTCVGRYMFTMDLSAIATPVGDAPEGARVDVLYNTGGQNRGYTKANSPSSPGGGAQWGNDWDLPAGPDTSDLQREIIGLLNKFKKELKDLNGLRTA